MGFKIAWCAVRGVSPEVVHEVFELGSLGRAGEHEVIDDDVYGIALPEWYVVVANTSYRAARPYYVETMPFDVITQRGAEALGCHVHETTMISGAMGWSEGVERWRLYHDGGQEGVGHLEVSGTPPEALGPIERALRQKQEGVSKVDYVFDIPVDVAHALVGYRHDRTPENARWYERLERL